MNFGSTDFKALNIVNSTDEVKTYDVEPVTSGFGDFGSVTEMKHTVVTGETLGTISAKYYGTSTKYMDIFNANRALMTARGPNYLVAGWTLVIPAVPVQRSTAVVAETIAKQAEIAVTQPSFIEQHRTKLLIGAFAVLAAAFIYKKKFKKGA